MHMIQKTHTIGINPHHLMTIVGTKTNILHSTLQTTGRHAACSHQIDIIYNKNGHIWNGHQDWHA